MPKVGVCRTATPFIARAVASCATGTVLASPVPCVKMFHSTPHVVVQRVLDARSSGFWPQKRSLRSKIRLPWSAGLVCVWLLVVNR